MNLLAQVSVLSAVVNQLRATEKMLLNSGAPALAMRVSGLAEDVNLRMRMTEVLLKYGALP